MRWLRGGGGGRGSLAEAWWSELQRERETHRIKRLQREKLIHQRQSKIKERKISFENLGKDRSMIP